MVNKTTLILLLLVATIGCQPEQYWLKPSKNFELKASKPNSFPDSAMVYYNGNQTTNFVFNIGTKAYINFHNFKGFAKTNGHYNILCNILVTDLKGNPIISNLNIFSKEQDSLLYDADLQLLQLYVYVSKELEEGKTYKWITEFKDRNSDMELSAVVKFKVGAEKPKPSFLKELQTTAKVLTYDNVELLVNDKQTDSFNVFYGDILKISINGTEGFEKINNRYNIRNHTTVRDAATNEVVLENRQTFDSEKAGLLYMQLLLGEPLKTNTKYIWRVVFEDNSVEGRSVQTEIPFVISP